MTRQQRRAYQRYGEREPGFTPVPSRRNDARRAAIAMAYIGNGLEPIEADRLAWRELARTLPPAPMVRSYSPKPSKSDDPKWRRP